MLDGPSGRAYRPGRAEAGSGGRSILAAMTKRRPATGEATVRSDRARHWALIFTAGAAALSLEVLASRVMTPYFGVSLYIWSGILSITLTFLALGYRLGGRLSADRDAARLELLLLAAPVASSAGIAVECALYPAVLPALSRFDLVLGSFMAAILLLALPLVALSAMNPILVTMVRPPVTLGDGGAGRVFFVSTLGSVAGVLITAFLFIPNLTNFRALLLLGVLLAGGSALSTASSRGLPAADRRRLLATALLVLAFTGSLLFGQRRYFDLLARRASGPYDFIVRAEYGSMFGDVKVVEIRPHDARLIPQLAYVQDGLIQNRTTLNGVSLLLYTYMLQKLAGAFAPAAREALVLGLGAGIVPTALARRGLAVSIVDINADALHAAEDHFGFAPQGMSLRWEDARTFVGRCREGYGIIVVDLFSGDGTPDYLLTSEFFRDLRRCLKPGGSAVMNAFFATEEEPNRRLLATVASAFPHVFEFRSNPGEGETFGYNAFVVGASATPSEGQLDFAVDDVPAPLVADVRRTLSSGRLVPPQSLTSADPVTDDHNIFSLLYARAELERRRAFAAQLPPHVLVN